MSRYKSPLLWPVLALLVLLVFNLVATPGFFHLEMRDGRLFGSLIDILNRGTPVLLLSLGMTLVIATGGIDLSVGAVMAIVGAVAACLIARPSGCVLNGIDAHGAVGTIVAISMMAALLCGLFNGFLVSVVGLQPFVATLLLMVAGRGLAQLLTDGQIVIFNHAGFQSLSTGATAGLVNPVWIAVVACVVSSMATHGTSLGQFIRAVGANPKAAFLSGINVQAVKAAAYVACALCAGVAGLIVTADIKGADANNAGLYLELDAILAVCIGGTSLAGGKFSFAGSVIGALVMQTLTTTILTRGVPAEATLVLKAVIVVAVCLLQARQSQAKVVVVKEATT